MAVPRPARQPTATRFGAGRWLAASLVLVALAGVDAGAAESTGRIETVASAPLPPHIAIAVNPKEASERNDVLQPAIEATLLRHGYSIDAHGPWQLQFATTVELTPRDRSIVHLLGRIGSDSRADLGLEIPLPQWPGAAAPAPVYRYTVWMTLGQTGRPAIWQGAATTVLARGESLATDRALADALLAVLGKSVASQTLMLPEPPEP